jgi:hypothetical protein
MKLPKIYAAHYKIQNQGATEESEETRRMAIY